MHHTRKETDLMSVTASSSLSIAVLISGTGRGSNLSALIEACSHGEIAGHIAVVIGTRSDVPALERAREAGVATVVISPRKYENDEAGYAKALQRVLQRYQVSLICLAGYMRKLPTEVVANYSGRIMN